MRKRRAAFLDRDGTISVERAGWLTRPDQLRLVRGSGAAIKRLNDAGVPVVVITNQSGVARGHLSEARLAEIHAELERRLRRYGAHVDLILYCPHHPTEGRAKYRKKCRCRKPAKGMLERAARDLDLRLDGSVVIGDDVRDLALSEGTGVKPILVRTGKGRAKEAEARAKYGRRLTVVDRMEQGVDAWLGRA